jgi:hypothetical protein
MQDIEKVINMEQYPLNDFEGPKMQALLRDLHEQWKKDGICVMPRFVFPEKAKEYGAEILEQKDFFFPSYANQNCYQGEEPDPTLPPDHAKNLFNITDCYCLSNDDIPNHTGLRAIYTEDNVMRMVAHIIHGENAPRFYRFADPLGCLTCNILPQGKVVGWHFDQAQFVVVLLLQHSEEGGTYDVVPESMYTTNEAGERVVNHQLHADVLQGKTKDYISHHFEAGSLVLHRGVASLHRVSPVTGVTPRVSCLLCYSEQPAKNLSAACRMAFYGHSDPRNGWREGGMEADNQPNMQKKVEGA